MNQFNYPNYHADEGYMTAGIRKRYIERAVSESILPVNAHRMADIISLDAANDTNKPIQFWQLYSVLGTDRIIQIVSQFYDKVFEQDHWFKSVFERVGTKNRHISTQSAMWADVMGGGHQYHGGEFRLNFHHTHNAMELMTYKGARRWVELMNDTLNDSDLDLTSDPRVRTSINTFLTFFMAKYAEDFGFNNDISFGDTNPPLKRRINFLKMTTDQIEALSEHELVEELTARRIDVSQYGNKQALVNKALSL